MKNTLKSVFAATLLVGFASGVQALPTVQGEIGIGAFGSYATIDKSLNTVSFVDTTPLILGNAQVNQATGDFGLLLGQGATYANFTYSPLTVSNPLWTLVIGTASFDLTSITTIDEAGPGLVLTGAGTIHLAGFEDTTGIWSFSADNTTAATFNFSSTTTAVPDGGTTVMLLGAALSGLGLIRRKLA